ncbi:MAG: hypothetical protein E6J65_27260, partial [Deltaproteobacteria bacterium]
ARGLREAVGKKIVEERGRAPFASIADLAARTGLRRDELAALAEIGALASVPMRPGGPLPTRRAALWQAEAASRRGQGLFARVEPREDAGLAENPPAGATPSPPMVTVAHEAVANLPVAARMSGGAGSVVAGGAGFALSNTLPGAPGSGPLAHVNAHPREHAIKALRTFGEQARSVQLVPGQVECSTQKPVPGRVRPPPGRARSPLPEMDLRDRIAADLRGTGMTVGPHPVALERERLRALGVHAAAELPMMPRSRRVRAAGLCIVRQRPGTAKGFVFLSLEDETGISHIVVDPPTFEKNRRPILASSLLVVEGRLEKYDGVTSVKGDRFWGLHEAVEYDIQSHDFH